MALFFATFPYLFLSRRGNSFTLANVTNRYTTLSGTISIQSLHRTDRKTYGKTKYHLQDVTFMIKAGILSDTHLSSLNQDFLRLVLRCFADCEVIIHAGDLTDISILDAFEGKTVHAVHGNCCGRAVRAALPGQLSFQLGAFTIGLTHGDRLGRYADNIESGLWNVFPEADCMIYGHTHDAVCHYTPGGLGRLIINPGSFQSSGRYGMPCSYATLEVGTELKGSLHEIPLR
jgi:putative phosphoesterase